MNDEQRQRLNADIPESVVHTKPGKGGASYVKGWWVIDQLNQILGPDGWSSETLSTRIVFGPVEVEGKRGSQWLVVYEAHVRIRVGETTHDGSACGSGRGGSIEDCMHNAIGEAETDALKRAARLFGRRVGLALYDSEQRFVSEELLSSVVHYGKHRGAPVEKAKTAWLVDYLARLPEDCPVAHRARVEWEVEKRKTQEDATAADAAE